MHKVAIKAWSMNGNYQWLDGGSMFGNVPRAVWQRWFEPDELSRIRLNCRCLLVELGGKKILCETGIGAFMEPKMRERFGVESDEHQLLRSLSHLALSPEQIDYVILSHLHFDHAGGLLPVYGKWQEPLTAEQLLFPNATYVIGAEAFKRAEQPHNRDRASFIPGLVQALKDSGRLLLIDREQPAGMIDPAISFHFSDGHTPGQMHTIFRGRERSMIFAGDLIPGTAWVHLPVTMGYDRFPERLIDEKSELYKTCVKDEWLVFLTHDPIVSACKIKYDEHGQRYQPVEPLTELIAFDF